MTCRVSTSLKAALIFGVVLSATGAAQLPDTRTNAYQAHFNKVRRQLPPHSALPPTLDLSKPNAKTTGAGHAWERKFTGSMRLREITDPGIRSVGVGLISTNTIENGTPVWALPARGCPVIVITKPTASAAHLAYTHRLVYSTFTLKIDQVLKGSRKQGIREENQIRAAEMGGTIRFPSGQIETFLWAREGFMRLGSKYLVFAWRPIKSDDTYVVAEAYLIENGIVYPVDLDAHESRYAGMSFRNFESKVKAAIAEDKDTN